MRSSRQSALYRCSDAVLVNATLNCLGGLVRSRQSIANKIVSTVLNFNPLKLANSPMTPKLKVQIKSMERTTRAFLMNILRRYARFERGQPYCVDIDNGPGTRTALSQLGLGSMSIALLNLVSIYSMKGAASVVLLNRQTGSVMQSAHDWVQTYRVEQISLLCRRVLQV